jgi:hypothetical protein
LNIEKAQRVTAAGATRPRTDLASQSWYFNLLTTA